MAAEDEVVQPKWRWDSESTELLMKLRKHTKDYVKAYNEHLCSLLLSLLFHSSCSRQPSVER